MTGAVPVAVTWEGRTCQFGVCGRARCRGCSQSSSAVRELAEALRVACQDDASPAEVYVVKGQFADGCGAPLRRCPLQPPSAPEAVADLAPEAITLLAWSVTQG